MIGVCELKVNDVGFQTFNVIRNYKPVYCKLEVGFRIPRSVRIAAAWHRNSLIVRGYDFKSFGNIIIRKALSPAVVFAGDAKYGRRIYKEVLVKISASYYIVALFVFCSDVII